MTTADKLSLGALIISIIAGVFSVYSYSANQSFSKKGFNKNYRPYVFASNYSRVVGDKLIPEISAYVIKLLNAPALKTKQQIGFFSRDGKTDNPLIILPEIENELIYPADNQIMGGYADSTIINHAKAVSISPKKMIRKIHIEYTWISKTDEKYFFTLESEYDIAKGDWVAIKQDAN